MQSTHSNTSQTKPNMNNPDEKITADLSTLSEQISLCQSMLVNAGPLSSIQDNEALLTVIGFLEACVPRMMELIEAAASGAIKEETFEMCLTVNDKLTNILADVEKDPEDRQPLTEVASAVGSSDDGDMVSDNKIDSDMNTLIISSEGADSTIKLGGKTTGMSEEDLRKPPPEEVDPFAGGPDLLQPTQTAPLTMMGTSTTTAESAMAPAASDGQAKTDDNDDDDFDAFFKDRTTAS